jgi:sec-independent protein translocase protein TatC
MQAIDTYLPYLEDIRRRIIFSVLIFISIFILGFFGAGPITKIFLRFFSVKDAMLIVNSPFQFFNISINIGLTAAFVFALPIAFFYMFSFLKSALTSRERKLVIFLIFLCMILFIVGFFSGIAIMYYAFAIMAQFNKNLGLVNIWDINFFISQGFMTSILFGLFFEFPVVLTALMRLGVLKISSLRNKRRFVYAGTFVFVSLLPPTDGLSLILMSLPIIFLYEITIFINQFLIRNKKCLTLAQQKL